MLLAKTRIRAACELLCFRFSCSPIKKCPASNNRDARFSRHAAELRAELAAQIERERELREHIEKQLNEEQKIRSKCSGQTGMALDIRLWLIRSLMSPVLYL